LKQISQGIKAIKPRNVGLSANATQQRSIESGVYLRKKCLRLEKEALEQDLGRINGFCFRVPDHFGGEKGKIIHR